MAFTSSLIKSGVMGDLRYAIFTWTSGTPTTTGSILTGFSKVLITVLSNKTAQRGTIADTTTAGTVTLSNLTADDTGYVLVYGY